VKIVTEEAISDLLRRAAAAPRRRLNFNLHAGPDDPINRFLNAGISGTYARPHRHRIGKWELSTVLRGALDVVTYDPDGMMTARSTLAVGATCLAEIPGGCWHSVMFHAPGAVVLEVKPGPYEPALDKEFAAWAPEEEDAAAPDFVTWLAGAAVGETWRGGYGSHQKPTPLA
jgi:cupin fold WbuC family metalloprotein